MTTALAVLNQGKMALSELEQMILAEAAEETAAYDTIPTKITISPGGTNIFTTPDGETMKGISCIIVVSQKARAYWPEKGSGSPPMCASFDGAHGMLQGEPTDAQYRAAMTARIPHPAIPLLAESQPIPPTFPCGACPMAQWGSAHQGGNGGKSQACKSLRRLVLIVDGWNQGALLTLPPTSIKGFDLYASALARQRSAYFAVRTKITLERQQTGAGDPYSVATFTKGDALTADEYMAVQQLRAQYAALVRAMPIESAEYETQGDMPTFHGADSDNENPF